ncbi:LRR receptor-like serine/threonine-protein kinase [Pyrus ussuriensis x Pyrus communis]|uniref:LRR receptor-like serine/threonine-protein kinase n=1 Tax=Pyrus ussuriensis x Pyrus communis TaxID=2448454 RepID=A0A5N5IA48_9ROSA|nr:LRR receptor-like serine/threonine-protein kinase [Pyrus ussuriensis x Pyrus communis]
MALEYEILGHLTDKANVYSFGIILLEAHVLKSERKLMNLLDPRLGSKFNNEEMMATINVDFHYCNSTTMLRPTMFAVVSMF